MLSESARTNTVLALLAAAGAWPTALCTLTETMASPLQRAMQTAWCGAAPQTMLGHCPACWSGMAAFMLAAALVALAPRRAYAHAKSQQ